MKFASHLYWTFIVVTATDAWNLNVCILHQTGLIYSEPKLNEHISSVLLEFKATESLKDIHLNASLYELDEEDILAIADDGCSRLPASCHSVITIADCPKSSLINAWASKNIIPHVIFNDRLCEHQSEHGVKLVPYYISEMAIVSSLTSSLEWTEVVILHDSLLGLGDKTSLINKLSKEYTAVINLEIEATDHVSYHMETILESQYRNIVVIARENNVREVFEQAKKMTMMSSMFYWLVYSDTLSLSTLLSDISMNGSNVLFLKAASHNGNYFVCFNTTHNCNDSMLFQSRLFNAFEILSLAFSRSTSPEMLNATYDTCSADPSDISIRQNVSEHLKQILFSSRNGQLQIDSNGYPVDIRFDISSLHDESATRFTNIGFWSTTRGLVLTVSQIYQNTFRDFGNRTLIIGALAAPPFNIKKTVGGQTIWEGFCFDILDELADKFKFTYIVKEPADSVWGSPLEDGTWNGIVGMVVAGKYSFGVGPLTITSTRETVIDFTKPYVEEGVGILTRRPYSESRKMFKMFTPFAPQVWACIVAGVAAVGLLLFFINKFSPYADHKLFPKTKQMTMKECMWLVYGSYMEQGADPHPRSISGRLILGFWWLFTILMASTYTANLAAFLTVTIAEKPINSLTELSEQSEILPLAKFGSNLYTLFKEAEDGIYKDIWDMMGTMPKLTSHGAALDLVREGKSAYMTDRSQLEYIVLNDCETYSLADETFNTAGLGFVMPENAAYSDAFNYHIMKMQEAGLIDKWKQKWWPSSDQCSGADRTSQAKTLDLDSLAGPFFIFLSVVGSAAILLLIEIIFYSKAFSKVTKCFKISDQNHNENEKE